jgi:hypothetical protein
MRISSASCRSSARASRFTVGTLEREDYTIVVDFETRYADLDLGLADCALIALAHRHQTTRADLRRTTLPGGHADRR